MLFKKFFILVFLILFSFSATANAPRSTGKYKNWESFTAQTDKGKICFAQTIPTKRAPASIKREKSKKRGEAFKYGSSNRLLFKNSLIWISC